MGVSVCKSVCVIHVPVCYMCANVRIKSFMYNWRVEKSCFYELCMIPSLTGYESTCTVHVGVHCNV